MKIYIKYKYFGLGFYFAKVNADLGYKYFFNIQLLFWRIHGYFIKSKFCAYEMTIDDDWISKKIKKYDKTINEYTNKIKK
ncbi:MAG TPA: hypothetical protein PLN85_00580 [archaeon]|jgi:hypothetical protein|nr:hypothetical protein [archaeon]